MGKYRDNLKNKKVKMNIGSFHIFWNYNHCLIAILALNTIMNPWKPTLIGKDMQTKESNIPPIPQAIFPPSLLFFRYVLSSFIFYIQLFVNYSHSFYTVPFNIFLFITHYSKTAFTSDTNDLESPNWVTCFVSVHQSLEAFDTI